MPHEYRKLSVEDVELYKPQLQRDAAKNFGEEFIRTTDLERKLIDEYGFDALEKLVCAPKAGANYFQPGEFPADCPWAHLNSKNAAECIAAVFAPIADKLPTLPAAMTERCRFVYAERGESGRWKLHYFLDITLYDEREYFRIYTGEAPNPNPAINESLAKFGWTIPRDLAEFYAVHDGFGELGDSIYVLNSQSIRVMAEMMNPIIEKNKLAAPAEYKFEDLLEFFPDAAGNAQCFYRENGDSANAETVDWDHETWEISGECDFYEFIDERMSALDEE